MDQNETTSRYFLLKLRRDWIGRKTISRWCPFKMSYVFEPTYGENVGAGLGGRLSVCSPVHPRYVRRPQPNPEYSIRKEIYKEADMSSYMTKISCISSHERKHFLISIKIYAKILKSVYRSPSGVSSTVKIIKLKWIGTVTTVAVTRAWWPYYNDTYERVSSPTYIFKASFPVGKLRKIEMVSMCAPQTRKSLVKGERFIRSVWRAWGYPKSQLSAFLSSL